VRDEAAAQAAIDAARGWWVRRCPVAEADHVWRVLVNSHLKSKALGTVVRLSAASFAQDAGGEVEVRVLVRDPADVRDLKRLGGSLLSVVRS